MAVRIEFTYKTRQLLGNDYCISDMQGSVAVSELAYTLLTSQQAKEVSTYTKFKQMMELYERLNGRELVENSISFKK